MWHPTSLPSRPQIRHLQRKARVAMTLSFEKLFTPARIYTAQLKEEKCAVAGRRLA